MPEAVPSFSPTNWICMPQGTSISRTRSPAGPLDSIRME